MTTIIAIEHQHGVTFGCDSLTSAGHLGYEKGACKVFDNGPLTIGAAGYVLFGNALRYMPLPKLDTWDVDRWVATDFTKALLGALEGARIVNRTDNTGHPTTNSAALVAAAGRVYQINPDASWVRRADGIYTIGSGDDFARGALTAMGVTGTERLDIIEQIVRRALEIAAAHDKGTGGTLHVRTVTTR